MAFSFESELSSEAKATLKSKVKQLSVISPWRALFPLAFEWALVFGIIAVSETYFSIPGYLLAIFLIATRQHAIGIFVHDGSHFRLVKNHRANIVISNLCCAYPLFFQMEMYRHNHLLHHQHTNNENDPDLKVTRGQSDWTFPMSLGKILKIYLLDFCGLGAIANFRRVARYTTDPEFKRIVRPELAKTKKLRLGFYALLAVLLFALSLWKVFLLYWMVPLLWMLPAVLRLRNMSEHYGLKWDTDLQGTRDVLCGPVERWLLAPHGVNYHLTHHFYPSVPFFNLPKLHQHLMTIPQYCEGAHLNTTYVLPTGKPVWKDWVTTGRADDINGIGEAMQSNA
jgi:fatty acid desaturase